MEHTTMLLDEYFFSDYHPFITSKYDFDSIFFPLFDEYVKKHNLTEEEAKRLLR